MSMKVILKKSVEDWFWCGDDCDIKIKDIWIRHKKQK